MTEGVGTGNTDRPGAGLVLYVDADGARQRTVESALEAAGFTLLRARDGREGVERFREHADGIRVVVLDLDLPDRSGDRAVHDIRGLRPTTPILVLSGESAEAIRSRFPGREPADVLQKPYRVAQVVQHVQAACGKRRYARLNVSLPVRVWAAERPGSELRGTLQRVAEGGLEVELPEAVPTGTSLRVLLQTRRGPIEVEGKVVFARATGEAVCHGLAFSEPKDFHFVLGLLVHDRG